MKKLLFTIDRHKHDADTELIRQMQDQNWKWKEKDFAIGALDYLHFKNFGTIYENRDWYVSNFIVKTTKDEYLIYQRYAKYN